MNSTENLHEYRTVWLSDVHLGSKDCQAEYLKSFLDSVKCERLYLVGDIVDIISLKRKFYWPASHYEIIQKIRAMAANGTEVIYIPGNHDAVMREYCGSEMFNIKVVPRYIHETMEGKKLLVVHGDELDHAILYRKLYRVIGDTAYDFMVFLHRETTRVRNIMGIPYWSLATYIKTHVKEARKVIEKFENAAIKLAKNEHLDGIVCGHIHQPEIIERNGILYCNDGDWTESCTALTESKTGELQLLHWSEQPNTLKVRPPMLQAA